MERGAPPAYYEGLAGHESLARPCGEVVSHSQTSPGTVDSHSPARARSLAKSSSYSCSCSFWKKGEVFDSKMGMRRDCPDLFFLSLEVAAIPLLPSTLTSCSYWFYFCSIVKPPTPFYCLGSSTAPWNHHRCQGSSVHGERHIK